MEYERQLIACMMHNKNIVYQSTVKEAYFTGRKYREIFRAIKHIVEVEELDPTIIEITEYSNGKIPAIDIMEISNAFGSDANWKYYEQKVINNYKTIQLDIVIKTASASLKVDTPEKVIEEIDSGIESIHKDIDSSELVNIGSLGPKFMKTMTDRAIRKGSLEGLSTPWKTVNSYTLGLKKGSFYIIAARPSEGKTALALNMMAHLGIGKKVPVGFLSVESPRLEMYERLIAISGNIGLSEIMACQLKQYEMVKLDEATGQLKDSNIIICDKANIGLSECKAQARRMKSKYKIEALFIDYVQIIDAEIKSEYRRDQIAKISLSLKQLARQLEIPVIACAQLNRDAQNNRPHLGNLADSSQIEKDADVVMFIYHKKVDKAEDSYLLIEKNRNGATGDIGVYFNRPTVTFREKENQRKG